MSELPRPTLPEIASDAAMLLRKIGMLSRDSLPENMTRLLESNQRTYEQHLLDDAEARLRFQSSRPAPPSTSNKPTPKGADRWRVELITDTTDGLTPVYTHARVAVFDEANGGARVPEGACRYEWGRSGNTALTTSRYEFQAGARTCVLADRGYGDGYGGVPTPDRARGVIGCDVTAPDGSMVRVSAHINAAAFDGVVVINADRPEAQVRSGGVWVVIDDPRTLTEPLYRWNDRPVRVIAKQLTCAPGAPLVRVQLNPGSDKAHDTVVFCFWEPNADDPRGGLLRASAAGIPGSLKMMHLRDAAQGAPGRMPRRISGMAVNCPVPVRSVSLPPMLYCDPESTGNGVYMDIERFAVVGGIEGPSPSRSWREHALYLNHVADISDQRSDGADMDLFVDADSILNPGDSGYAVNFDADESLGSRSVALRAATMRAAKLCEFAVKTNDPDSVGFAGGVTLRAGSLDARHRHARDVLGFNLRRVDLLGAFATSERIELREGTATYYGDDGSERFERFDANGRVSETGEGEG